MITLGNHVNWEKLKGESTASNPFSNGFGTLGSLPEVNTRLRIEGDNGILTSYIQSVDDQGDTVIIETQFSTYKITKW